MVGNWNGDKIEGETLIEYNNGSVFRGKTGNNLEKIEGEYISKSGTTYQGYYRDDEPSEGVLIYSNRDNIRESLLVIRDMDMENPIIGMGATGKTEKRLLMIINESEFSPR